MPPKRKSDGFPEPPAKKAALAVSTSGVGSTDAASTTSTAAVDKAASALRTEPRYLKRVIGGVPPVEEDAEAEEPKKKTAGTSGDKKAQKAPVGKPQKWQDVVLDGEDVRGNHEAQDEAALLTGSTTFDRTMTSPSTTLAEMYATKSRYFTNTFCSRPKRKLVLTMVL